MMSIFRKIHSGYDYEFIHHLLFLSQKETAAAQTSIGLNLKDESEETDFYKPAMRHKWTVFLNDVNIDCNENKPKKKRKK